MTEEEIDRLVASFESHELPLKEWNHAAHLTVATAYSLADPDGALDKIRPAIQGFNISKGVPQTDTGGYHESITVFFMHMVKHVIDTAPPGLARCQLVARVVERLGDRRAMLEYYSRELAMSKEARYGWVEPDIKPLP